MNKVDTVSLFDQNSYGVYKEKELVKKVKDVLSPYAGVHQERISMTLNTIIIPTTLHIQQISDRNLVNSLSKINAKTQVTPLDHEIFVVCQRPKPFPAWVHGVFYLGYSLFSWYMWRTYLKWFF